MYKKCTSHSLRSSSAVFPWLAGMVDQILWDVTTRAFLWKAWYRALNPNLSHTVSLDFSFANQSSKSMSLLAIPIKHCVLKDSRFALIHSHYSFLTAPADLSQNTPNIVNIIFGLSTFLVFLVLPFFPFIYLKFSRVSST